MPGNEGVVVIYPTVRKLGSSYCVVVTSACRDLGIKDGMPIKVTVEKVGGD